MDTTPNLALPYLFAAQAQKHVTHNEALRVLDAVVNVSVLDRSLASPPLSPTEGARYIVAPGATGAWTGTTGRIAAFQDGAWAFYIPREGWLAWVADEDILVVYDGAAWMAAGSGSVNPTPLVGVNTTADVTNRLAVSSSAILLNHAGAGHQAKINKNLATDTASFLFQTGFSGRAEMGTTGDDDFHFKVSPDGATWKDALQINKTTGAVTMPFTAGGGGGEANTASNVNVGGVGAFKQKTGINLEFRGINAASGAISVALDAANNEIDIDVPNDGITNAKLANVPTATLKGRTTAATGDPEDLTAAQARTLLNVADGANNYVHPNHSGDVTSVADGATTIVANAVTNAKLADVPTATLKGRTTAATGDPEDLTAAQARTLLNVADGANNYVHPNHSGDVTSVADGATTIVANAVTNAKLADVPTATLKGRTTAATGDPEDLTAAQARTLLNVADGANNYVHPNHSGDVTSVADGATTIVANAVTNAKLADVPTATLKGRTTAATGDPEDLTVAQAKTLLNLAGTNTGDQTITLTGDVTGTGTGSFAATVANDAVTNAKLANVPTATLKGRTTAATGDPEDLTAAQARTLLNVADGANNYVHPNHSGDVTSVADGATTIAANAVTYGKMQDVSAASRLLGRGDSGVGDPQEITLGAGLAMTGTVLSSSGGGGSITTQDEGVTLSAGVTTLNFTGAGVTASGAGATTTITIPGGGGGGTPGGADTNVQFNDAGVFGGVADFLFNKATRLLTLIGVMQLNDEASIPGAPTAAVKLFSRSVAGRRLPWFIAPANLATPLQPAMFRTRARWLAIQGNATTVTAVGLTNTTTGTATTRSVATTNLLTSMARAAFVSAATAGASAGTRHGAAQFFMGNGTAGIGGYHYVTRFAVSDAAAVANARMAVGLSATTGAFANADPSTLLNQIIVGCDAGQTTLRIMHNDGAGASTVIDLGANFPSQTLSTDAYELQLYCAPNGSTVSYRVERLNTGHVAEGTISTDLPANTTLMSPQIWRNNGVTALAVGIDVMTQYIETDY